MTAMHTTRRASDAALLRICLPLCVFPFGAAYAGGSNYGITPGAHHDLAGKVSEWPVPTPRFARDPAVAPDGSIYIAVMSGNKVARFDEKSKTFKEWDLPSGHRPHGLLVDRQGNVWTTGNGNGTIGKLDPATGRMTSTRRRRAAAARIR
jgi:virginiamycin B lyase